MRQSDYGFEDRGYRFCHGWGCLLAWPGAVGASLFDAVPVSSRESAIIGALLFVAAAIVFLIRPNDKTP
jgi:hypothetical protein